MTSPYQVFARENRLRFQDFQIFFFLNDSFEFSFPLRGVRESRAEEISSV